MYFDAKEVYQVGVSGGGMGVPLKISGMCFDANEVLKVRLHVPRAPVQQDVL